MSVISGGVSLRRLRARRLARCSVERQRNVIVARSCVANAIKPDKTIRVIKSYASVPSASVSTVMLILRFMVQNKRFGR